MIKLLLSLLLVLNTTLAQDSEFNPIQFDPNDVSSLELPLVFDADGSLGLKIGSTSVDINDFAITAVGDFNRKRYLLNNSPKIYRDIDVQLSEEKDKYLRLSYFKWDLGLGAAINAEIAKMSLSLGATPFVSKTYTTARNLNSRSESRKKLELPLGDNEKEWRIGDQIKYTSENGVYFNLPLGIWTMVNIGPEFILTGQFVFSIKKIKEDKYSVKVKTLKNKQYSLRANLLLPYIRAGLGKNLFIDYEYLLDLTNPEHQTHLQFILSGNLKHSNEFLVAQDSLQQRVRFTQYGVRVPIIYSIMKDRSKSYTKISNPSNESEHYIYVMNNTQRTKGALARKKTQGFRYISTYRKGEEDRVSSKAIWMFEKKKTTGNALNRKLRKLAAKTGLKDLLKIKFPNRKYKFTKVVLELPRPLKYIKAKLKSFENSSVKEQLRKLSLDLKNNLKLSKDFAPTGKLYIIGENFKKHIITIKE